MDSKLIANAGRAGWSHIPRLAARRGSSRAVAWSGALLMEGGRLRRSLPAWRRGLLRSSRDPMAVDAIRMLKPRIGRPGAVALAALAASDLAYRLLVRKSLRRAMGMNA
jgi:hypothetical protein